MERFWGRFLRYRFDFAALAFDCVATFFYPVRRPLGRVLALLGAAFMMLPPVFVLIIGNNKFGDGWAFGLTLVIFVVLIEAPAHLWRKGVANGGHAERPGHTFDQFLFGLFTLLGMLAPLVLFEVSVRSDVLRGIIWGIALVGAQDVVRTAIACALALSGGRPVYS